MERVLLNSISGYFIPVIVLAIVLIGLLRKRDVYQDFVKGAKGGVKTVMDIMPTLIGLMVAVGVMRDSGLLDCISKGGELILGWTGIPVAVIPVAIVKMFSSSAATGLVLDIFKTYGVDSYPARIVSVMMGSTETIFYTMSVYFMSVKITKSRWTLAGAVISMLAGIAASVVIVGI